MITKIATFTYKNSKYTKVTYPIHKKNNFTNLGVSELAKKLSISPISLKGRWCSNCKGIWFGFSGEVECVVCKSRDG